MHEESIFNYSLASKIADRLRKKPNNRQRVQSKLSPWSTQTTKSLPRFVLFQKYYKVDTNCLLKKEQWADSKRKEIRCQIIDERRAQSKVKQEFGDDAPIHLYGKPL